MVKVGIAGIGFMGWIHWLAYQQIEGVQVVAICDTDPVRLQGDWTSIKGNFGPAGEDVDLTGIAVFDNLNSFCGSDFDMIDICLPPALHVPAIQQAASFGKHVFCEKPLALKPESGASAVDACQRAGKLLMVGHVLPFFPEFLEARKIVESGDYGKLTAGYFKRIISNPTWLSSFFDSEKVGGPLLDLHVHDAHFIRLLAGMPLGVYSRGSVEKDVVRFCHSIFDFDDPSFSIATTMGVIDQQGRPFTHGFEIHLEQATIHFEYSALESGDELMPLKLITDDGKVALLPNDNSDPVGAFVAEIREVVESVKNEQPSSVLSGELALDAIKICEAESKSVNQRQRISIA